ncbi:hypothetical protein L5515_002262 [Caenorhabditis briggsae]|uniref:Protein kinase domain-containing protein n=2 Tax=Caenorhabditis briggsae TaxID=6238 RepID=A0AAE9E895_CAEBR|nr:hypothetical protein L5515_002262 [Caenorhabditis briggsae]
MTNENEKKEEKVDEKDPMDAVKFKPGKRFGPWIIDKTLDEGGFGQVYLVKTDDGKRAALKAESNEVEGGSAIKLESLILKKLNKNGPKPHVPQLHVAAKRKKYCYMVMTLLGENLKSLRMKRPKERLTRGTWSRIGIQCLYALKYMHDCGFVHRDIKPQNFMMGNEDDKERARIVHILDFGLARSFARYSEHNKSWTARRARGSAEFRGTLRYTSPNVHLRKEQGRVDDIWSLLYVLIELNGGLPWQKAQKREEVEAMKMAMSDQDVMLNMPSCMGGVIPHFKKLDYYQRPDYHLVFKALWQVMLNEGQKLTSRFDWETKDPDPSIPAADWENPDGRFFKQDSIGINGPPPNDKAGANESTILETEAIKSDKGKSLMSKRFLEARRIFDQTTEDKLWKFVYNEKIGEKSGDKNPPTLKKCFKEFKRLVAPNYGYFEIEYHFHEVMIPNLYKTEALSPIQVLELIREFRLPISKEIRSIFLRHCRDPINPTATIISMRYDGGSILQGWSFKKANPAQKPRSWPPEATVPCHVEIQMWKHICEHSKDLDGVKIQTLAFWRKMKLGDSDKERVTPDALVNLFQDKIRHFLFCMDMDATDKIQLIKALYLKLSPAHKLWLLRIDSLFIQTNAEGHVSDWQFWRSEPPMTDLSGKFWNLERYKPHKLYIPGMKKEEKSQVLKPYGLPRLPKVKDILENPVKYAEFLKWKEARVQRNFFFGHDENVGRSRTNKSDEKEFRTTKMYTKRQAPECSSQPPGPPKKSGRF